MSQNPFDALGGEGGLDMNALLQQAQQMQEQLQAAQQQLEETTIDGTAGGAVTVTVTGTGELTGVTVTPGHFDGDDAESLTDLGDLVVAAFRDARAKADAMVQEQMGPLAGGGLPGLPGDPGTGQGGGGPLGFQ
jgi:nucleoid-associated protein EbfC